MLKEDNAFLNDESERLKWENHKLKSEQEHLQSVVSKIRAKINNLEKEEMLIIDNICNLRKKFDEMASEKNKQELVLNLCQINYNSVVRKLIEDIELM